MLRWLLFFTIVLAPLARNADASPKRTSWSADQIAWAIGVDHSWLNEKQRMIYARALKESSVKHGFDPIVGVALIWHESKWRASAVGDNGRAIGLAQIHYQGLCKDQQSCEQKRAQLLSGTVNIATMGAVIGQKRQWCRKQTGKEATTSRWLHAYGYKQRKDLKCNMQKVKGRWRDLPVPTEEARIISYHRRLTRLLSTRRSLPRRPK